jgi:hypothetical protein
MMLFLNSEYNEFGNKRIGKGESIRLFLNSLYSIKGNNIRNLLQKAIITGLEASAGGGWYATERRGQPSPG